MSSTLATSPVRVEVIPPSVPGGVEVISHFILDRAVLNVLTEGQIVLSAEPSGNSAWASTAKITVKNRNGTLHAYFLKIVKGELAGPRVLGEFLCMSELYKTMPSIVPAPKGYGKCLDSDDHFFMCDYLEIDHRTPDEAKLAESISELHRSSVSPTGQFGFHVTTYDGKLPLVTQWDSNWVSFYGKLLEGVYNLDVRANGHWTRLDDAMKLILDKVVPRLLGRLYEDNRTVKPCLIHGDLWEQNIGTDPRTENIYIFDACAYYAHHEMAIGMWRVNHHLMNAPRYRNSYFKLFKPDEPVDEYDDRNRLYCLKEKIMYSAHVPGTKARGEALDDMLYLIGKYVGDE